MILRILVFTGSTVLYLKGLLDRKPKDLDILCHPYSKRLHRFIRKKGIKVDGLSKKPMEYELLGHKNRYIKVEPTHVILYHKYFSYTYLLKKGYGHKHRNDIIDVFKHLGGDASLEEIHKMQISLEDRVELLCLLKIAMKNA